MDFIYGLMIVVILLLMELCVVAVVYLVKKVKQLDKKIDEAKNMPIQIQYEYTDERL